MAEVAEDVYRAYLKMLEKALVIIENETKAEINRVRQEMAQNQQNRIQAEKINKLEELSKTINGQMQSVNKAYDRVLQISVENGTRVQVQAPKMPERARVETKSMNLFEQKCAEAIARAAANKGMSAPAKSLQLDKGLVR